MARRMAYDDDGTVVQLRRTPGFPFFAASAVPNLNSENASSQANLDGASQFNNHPGMIVFIFPELRDIEGIFIQIAPLANRIQAIETSADTTTGLDGTWIQQIANYTEPADTVDSWYLNPQAVTWNAVRAVRVNFTNYRGAGFVFRLLHLYGVISAGSTPDRVAFVDQTTGLVYDDLIDFLNVPRGSARDFQMRIRNLSVGQTANNVVLDSEELTGTSGGWYTFDNGGGFSGSLSVPSIGPGTDSGVITVRQIIPDSEATNRNAGRLFLTVSSWT